MKFFDYFFSLSISLQPQETSLARMNQWVVDFDIDHIAAQLELDPAAPLYNSAFMVETALNDGRNVETLIFNNILDKIRKYSFTSQQLSYESLFDGIEINNSVPVGDYDNFLVPFSPLRVTKICIGKLKRPDILDILTTEDIKNLYKIIFIIPPDKVDAGWLTKSCPNTIVNNLKQIYPSFNSVEIDNSKFYERIKLFEESITELLSEFGEVDIINSIVSSLKIMHRDNNYISHVKAITNFFNLLYCLDQKCFIVQPFKLKHSSSCYLNNTVYNEEMKPKLSIMEKPGFRKALEKGYGDKYFGKCISELLGHLISTRLDQAIVVDEIGGIVYYVKIPEHCEIERKDEITCDDFECHLIDLEYKVVYDFEKRHGEFFVFGFLLGSLFHDMMNEPEDQPPAKQETNLVKAIKKFSNSSSEPLWFISGTMENVYFPKVYYKPGEWKLYEIDSKTKISYRVIQASGEESPIDIIKMTSKDFENHFGFHDPKIEDVSNVIIKIYDTSLLATGIQTFFNKSVEPFGMTPVPEDSNCLDLFKSWLSERCFLSELYSYLKIEEHNKRQINSKRLINSPKFLAHGKILFGQIQGYFIAIAEQANVHVKPSNFHEVEMGVQQLKLLHSIGITHNQIQESNLCFDPIHNRVCIFDYRFAYIYDDPKEVEPKEIERDIAKMRLILGKKSLKC